MRSLALRPFGHVGELLADAHVEVAAELDVGAAAGHVGGDGHRAGHAGLGDDERLLLVVAGVQDLVRDLLLVQHLGEDFRLGDRGGADQDRLAALAASLISSMIALYFSSAVR